MIGTVYSAGMLGFEGTLVKVEVDIANGFPGWIMVGLAEKAVQESRERVTAALRNTGIHLEARKTTINLAPATHKKSGAQYDLPIAVGLLLAHQVLTKNDFSPFLFVGELSLTGELKPIHGTLIFSMMARQKKFAGIICPKANAEEARLIKEISVIGCETMAQVIDFLNDGTKPIVSPGIPKKSVIENNQPDFCDVKGQSLAKRALEIAAAGGHHVIMMGPPGSGKTMLANRFPTILPPLNEKESLETTKIYSAMGLLDTDHPLITRPPIRSPHHSTSYAGLIGGGDGYLAPGEITLAHNGVLFLDELPEFRRDSLQMLRQPLEAGHVIITRVKGRLRLPSRFLLLAALNPCKCGYLGHPHRNCVCAPGNVLQYRRKISGPLLDRIDLHVEVSALTESELFDNLPSENSAQIRERVLAARKRPSNGVLTKEAAQFFRKIFPTLRLSVRAHDKILKVAQTIANLEASEKIATHHIAEAIQYRCLDKEETF